MGVPVLTLGATTPLHAHNVGVSLLTTIGCPELITYSIDDYIAKAIELGNNPHKLAQLRLSLRDKLLQSPLCDGPKFSRGLEEAFSAMWKSASGVCSMAHNSFNWKQST